MATTTTSIQKVEVEGLTLAYREMGDGPAVLLLHGWPTSSYLWREVMPPIAASNRVVALDLPGFGASDKPLDVSYDFAFFGRILDGFLAALEIEEVALAVHDLGGPVGLHWGLHRPERVTAVAILNTLVYPEFSDAVLEFVKACSTPELAAQLTSPEGLEEVMRLGLEDDSNLTPEVLAAVGEPFATDDSRRALAAAGIGLELEGFPEIARLLPGLSVPVRILYGERDRVLPDVADTMARVAGDVPHAEVTSLPCGHFLQEEAPREVGERLAEFFARATAKV
jgi:pimeloyl-ACP methyl ester carboxylesterase